MSQSTARIIQDYLARGGQRMDEEHYQQYRAHALTKWLRRHFIWDGPCDLPWRCPPCLWIGADIDACLMHLKICKSHLFVADDYEETNREYKREYQRKKARAKKKAKAIAKEVV